MDLSLVTAVIFGSNRCVAKMAGTIVFQEEFPGVGIHNIFPPIEHVWTHKNLIGQTVCGTAFQRRIDDKLCGWFFVVKELLLIRAEFLHFDIIVVKIFENVTYGLVCSKRRDYVEVGSSDSTADKIGPLSFEVNSRLGSQNSYAPIFLSDFEMSGLGSEYFCLINISN